MTDSRTNSAAARPSAFGTDLHLGLNRPGLRAGLTDALREAVRTGRLVPDTRLPASRSPAADLGISRNTVTESYAELVAEGWLTAQQGSGARVARRAELRRAAPAAPSCLPHSSGMNSSGTTTPAAEYCRRGSGTARTG